MSRHQTRLGNTPGARLMPFGAALLLLLILFTPISALASPAPPGEGDEFQVTLQYVIQGLDLEKLDESLEQSDLGRELFANRELSSLIAGLAKGETVLNAWDILKSLFSRFIKSLQANLLLVLQFLSIAIVMALLGSVGPSVLSGEIAELCQFIGYLLAVLLAARTLGGVFAAGIAAITALTGVMEAIFPVLLTLLTALGSTASAGVFQPAMTLLTGSIITLVKRVCMPAVLAGGVLTIVDNISARIQVKSATNLVNKCAQWLTAVVFVVFLGVTALQGLAGAAFDGVSIRTAKYAIDKFFPIVGGMVSDTVDTLVGCSFVVKQGVGIIGLFILCTAILEPVIKMAAVAISFRVAAAIIEPFGDKRLPDCLNGMAHAFTLLYIAVLAAGTMMFILITLLIRAGTVNMMLR
jgi:stage III sporulation protein AE